MNIIQEILSAMPLEDVEQLTVDFEQFEKDGFIGDCLLRKTAQNLPLNGMQNANVAIFMYTIAFEAYRHLYRRLSPQK